jgi:hypothetical protein
MYRPPRNRETIAATAVRIAEISNAVSIPRRKAGATAFGKNCRDVRVASTAGLIWLWSASGRAEMYRAIGF